MENGTLFIKAVRNMNLALRWKSCTCLSISTRIYVWVDLVCASLCLQPSPIICWRDRDNSGMHCGDLSFWSWSIPHGNDLCFSMTTANAVTPQTDYLKCYVLHLHTLLLCALGRRKLNQVGQIIQGLLADIAVFCCSCVSAFWGRSKDEHCVSLRSFLMLKKGKKSILTFKIQGCSETVWLLKPDLLEDSCVCVWYLECGWILWNPVRREIWLPQWYVMAISCNISVRTTFFVCW